MIRLSRKWARSSGCRRSAVARRVSASSGFESVVPWLRSFSVEVVVAAVSVA